MQFGFALISSRDLAARVGRWEAKCPKLVDWGGSNIGETLILYCLPQLPEIFNTDQGSQFTAAAFTGVLKRHGIRITPDEAYFGQQQEAALQAA